MDDVSKIRKNVKTQCPMGLQTVCNDLAKPADAALKEDASNVMSRRRRSDSSIHLERTCLSQPSQILLRFPHIPPNLLFQSFDRRELDLVPQAIQEVNLNFGFR